MKFETVVLLGMEEGNFPYYKHLNNLDALFEDDRLCYFCLSRAKKNCILVGSSMNKITKKDGTVCSK